MVLMVNQTRCSQDHNFDRGIVREGFGMKPGYRVGPVVMISRGNTGSLRCNGSSDQLSQLLILSRSIYS